MRRTNVLQRVTSFHCSKGERECNMLSLSPPRECKQRQDWVLPPERMGDDAPDHASRVH